MLTRRRLLSASLAAPALIFPHHANAFWHGNSQFPVPAIAGISATATALPAFTTGALTELALGTGGLGGGGANVLTVGPVQILNSTTATTFLVGSMTFSASTAAMYGSLQARRMR